MTQVTKPPKHLVREFLERRTHAQQEDPPPTIDDIRRELGWELIIHPKGGDPSTE